MTEETEQTTDNQPDNNNANGGGSEQTEGKFSQDHVDAIIKERLGRATEMATTELLEKLGVGDIDTATKAIKEAEATRLAQMSELEKSQAETVAANEALAKMEAEIVATKATAAEALLRAAVTSAAANFNDPDDAWVHIDRAAIELKPDGTYKGLDKAIKALVEAKPYLIKSDDSPNLGTPTRNKTILKSLDAQERKKIPREYERPNINF
jgi:uncharacterized protein (DUF2147 family)